MNTPIIENSLNKAVSYNTYRNHVKKLISEGKSTGNNQSDELLDFSKLNDKRMDRLDKTLKVLPSTQQTVNHLTEDYTLLVIAEGWCGDAAQVLPIVNKISEASDRMHLKVVLRDENDDLMNEFLTNGSKSIPKMIILDKEQNVIDSWGPRPSVATKMVQDYKAAHGKVDATIKKDLQLWYNKDKGTSTQEDILKILQVSN